MKRLRTPMLALAVLGMIAPAFAAELVYNPGLEIQDSEGLFGDGWGLGGPSFDGDRSGIFDDWGTIPGFQPGVTAWLGLIDGEDITLSQSINTNGYSSGVLSFNLHSDGWDDSNPSDPFDFLTVTFAGVLLDTIDLGNDGTAFTLFPSYDISSLLNSGNQMLEIRVVNDTFEGSNTFSWVDDISIQAQPVPEPATMAALGLGALALIKRRRKN